MAQKRKRVLLIAPPGRTTAQYSDSWFLAVRDYGKFPPLGLLYLAACVRGRGAADVAVVDALTEGLSFEQIQNRAGAFRPDIVGITSFTVSFLDTVRIAGGVKEQFPETHVCVGGPHLNVFPEQTIRQKNIDSIVIGEGEEVFPKLVEVYEPGGDFSPPGGVVTKKNVDEIAAAPHNRVRDLDALPFPARDLVGANRYSSIVGVRPLCLTLVASRGCPFDCTFCDTPHHDYRMRSVENVMSELEACGPTKKHEVFLYDDIFNINKKRIVDFAEALLSGGLRFPWSFRARADRLDLPTLKLARRAGCFQIHIGVETTLDENLGRLKKGITMEQVRGAVAAARRAGIRVIADHMIGLPFEDSEADIYDNLRRLIRLNPHFVQINIFQPLPGTEIFDEGVERGVIKPERWSDYAENPAEDFQPQAWDEFIPQGEMGRIFRRCYHMFYFRPRKILEQVFSVRSAGEFLRKFAAMRRLLSPVKRMERTT